MSLGQPRRDPESKKPWKGDFLREYFSNIFNNISVILSRTTRWLDRCIKAHKKPDDQNIFPIVQGALDMKLRTISAQNHVKRNVNGYAIGGLR